MTALQPDLFSPLLFYFEITAREAVTERRWKPGVPPTESYRKTEVVWFTEIYQAETQEAALQEWRADHPAAQIRGVMNKGPVEND